MSADKKSEAIFEMLSTYLSDMEERGDNEASDLLKLIKVYCNENKEEV